MSYGRLVEPVARCDHQWGVVYDTVKEVDETAEVVVVVLANGDESCRHMGGQTNCVLDVEVLWVRVVAWAQVE